MLSDLLVMFLLFFPLLEFPLPLAFEFPSALLWPRPWLLRDDLPFFLTIMFVLTTD